MHPVANSVAPAATRRTEASISCRDPGSSAFQRGLAGGTVQRMVAPSVGKTGVLGDRTGPVDWFESGCYLKLAAGSILWPLPLGSA